MAARGRAAIERFGQHARHQEYIGSSLHIVTAGAAANLSEIPAHRVLFDEVDRANANVNGEGDPVQLAKARQTSFERNRKSSSSSFKSNFPRCAIRLSL